MLLRILLNDNARTPPKEENCKPKEEVWGRAGTAKDLPKPPPPPPKDSKDKKKEARDESSKDKQSSKKGDGAKEKDKEKGSSKPPKIG